VQIDSLRTDQKFKKTEIGEIPVDWEIVGLGELTALYKNAFVDGPFGSNLKLKDYVKSGVPVLQGKNITSDRLEWFDIRYVSEKKAHELARSLVRVGDVLMTKIGTVGCSAVVDTLRGYNAALIPANLMKISLNAKRINVNYLYQWLIWPRTKRRIIDVASQTAQPALSLKTMKSFKVSVPPLPEQKKIAEILSTVDEAIEKSDQIIEKTQELKKGLMQELLTRGIGHKKFKKTPIGEIPEEWEVVKLKDIAASQKYSFVDGPFGSNLKSMHYTEQGVPVIQSQFIISGKFRPTETFYVSEQKAKELIRSKVVPGDIVIAKIGVNYGASATVPANYPIAVLSGNTMKITPNLDKMLTEFLQYALHYFRMIKRFDGIVSTTAQPAITLKGIKNLKISLPKISEQKKIAEILSSVDEQIEKAIIHKERLEEIKKGLMQMLLTGKVRVKV